MHLRHELFRIIADAPRNTFALFHMPPPHGPHVFEPDGTYAGPYRAGGPYVSDYERSLVYIDFYIGEIVARLREAGKFDDALIIFTSDHARIAETEPIICEDPDWNRRVPLIIKLPGQQSGLVLDYELCTNQLQPLFEAVFGGERDTTQLIDVVRQLGISGHAE
jgi:arylsulfatase A-like enzyme